MKKSDEIRQQIAELTDSMQAMVEKAEREGRELSAVEHKTFVDTMENKIPALTTKLETIASEERNMQSLRTIRATANDVQPLVLPVNGRLPGSNVNVVAPRLSAFTGNGNREQGQRDAYDVGLWFKATILKDHGAREQLISRRGGDWLASQNEGTAADGGYLVPAPLSAAILVSREQVGAMRKLATIAPMTSETLSIPKQTGGTTVYYPGEEGTFTASDASFSQVSLQAKKRAILTYVSNELREDAIVPVMDFIAQDMGHAFALKEDQEGIVGDGTSTYGGVHGLRPAVIAATASVSTAATGHDTWAELDVSDFLAAMSLLPDKFRVAGNLSWLCSAAFKWQVMDRLAINSNGAVSMTMVDGLPQDRFLGYPVVLSDRMPTSGVAATVACLFGNFPRAVFLGDRGGIRLATSEHVAFTTDQVAVRATTRYDIQVHEEGDTATAGAIVGLKTAA